MNIFIATYGSRGDVQPFVALGKGLRQAGHRVTLGTSERFRNVVEKHGLAYGYMNDGLLSIIDTDQGRELLENTRTIFDVARQYVKLKKQLKPLQIAQMRETWDIAKRIKPDCILYHPKIGAGPHIAEKLGIDCALATPIPMFVPTADRPFPVLPDLKLGGWYNRLSYRIIKSLTGIFLRTFINRFREDIGLAPMRQFDFLKTTDGTEIPVLHAHSEAVVPRPRDWPDDAHVTGYWFLGRDSEWAPPPDLRTFLEAGMPPVYVGFGSMAGRHPRRLARIVIGALQLTGVRGILATGWGGLKPEVLPDSILTIDSAPHDWLFPRVSAVVHHGGAGTTAAGLRAGRPTIIVPFFGDQPFWGRQVHRLGAGTKPIVQNKLTPEKLAAAIGAAVASPGIRRKAEVIGERIRREDGVAHAVSVIERTMT